MKRRVGAALAATGLVLSIVAITRDASAVIARPLVVVSVAPGYFVPPIVVLHRGMSLLLVQGDPAQRHDVVSRGVRPDRRPLFTTPQAPSFGHLVRVDGVESLPVGAYPFTCSIHPFMYGQVIVE